jgi:2-octaprenyl-6-methoxyphenol hydroxylase
MNSQTFDVAIIGGGPTGCALALELARHSHAPERIALIHHDGINRYGKSSDQDTRVIAVNQGTRVMLQALDIWPNEASTITFIHVSQSGRLGRTVICSQELGVEALGYVLSYPLLYRHLLQAAKNRGITLIQTKTHDILQSEHEVRIGTASDALRARLAVRADGMNHTDRSEHFDQVALIGQVRVSEPNIGWAYERFTRDGPFAVLPNPADPQTQSIVWCCSPARAAALMQLNLAELACAMQAAFGERLGKFTVDCALQSFPLYRSLAHKTVQGRLLSIGNAAQTLHPVAGQGLNLGLRDAATLGHCLRDWIAYPNRNPKRALDIYANLRRNDREITAGLTNFMSWIFTTRLPIIEHAAGLSLLSLDLFGPLRAPLARHLMQGLRA